MYATVMGYNERSTESTRMVDSRIFGISSTRSQDVDTAKYEHWIKHGAQPSGTLATVVRKTAAAAKKASA